MKNVCTEKPHLICIPLGYAPDCIKFTLKYKPKSCQYQIVKFLFCDSCLCIVTRYYFGSDVCKYCYFFDFCILHLALLARLTAIKRFSHVIDDTDGYMYSNLIKSNILAHLQRAVGRLAGSKATAVQLWLHSQAVGGYPQHLPPLIAHPASSLR